MAAGESRLAVSSQLFSYHVALERSCDMDKPRNLAKPVQVESEGEIIDIIL